MRRILSIFLMQMVLVLSVSTVAFADGEGLEDKIYLENNETDVEVEYDDSFLFLQNLSTISTSWQIKNNSEKRGKGMHLEKGENIRLVLSLSNTSNVKVGIVKSNGAETCVLTKKSIHATIQVPKTGTYYVFVRNKSGKKITVNGYYSY